jgi:hypothetical protein
MHSGTGLLGHGWRANNTIAHAVRLCMNNIGNLRRRILELELYAGVMEVVSHK